MDAGILKVFEAVAWLGGMNRAEAELNTVQSNVTVRIRQLETELGVPLFRRHPPDGFMHNSLCVPQSGSRVEQSRDRGGPGQAG
jgi:hypothetical protein